MVSELPGGYTTFGEAASVFRKGIFDIKADSYVDDGVPFVRISNLKNGLINDTDIAYITEEAHRKEQNTALVYGDIVLSKTAYAAASFVNLSRCNVSQDTVAVRIKTEWQDKLKSAFVVSYLNSRYGNQLLMRQFQGNVQMHLSLPDGEMVKLPLISGVFQLAIEKTFLNSFQQAKDADKFYARAEQILLQALQLDTWQPSEPNTYESTFAQVSTAERFDAEYFQPKYATLVAHVKANAPGDLLRNLATLIDHGKQPPYVDDGEALVFSQKYIGRTSIDYNFVNDEDITHTSLDFAKANPDYVLHYGDVVHYSVGAYLGRAQAFLEKEPLAMPGSFITLIRADKAKVNSIYLSIVMNSMVGQMQSVKHKSASAQPYIYPKDIRGFWIPLLPDATQDAIAQLVVDAHHARARAKSLLDVAKRAVEVAIEHGEAAGLALLSAARTEGPE